MFEMNFPTRVPKCFLNLMEAAEKPLTELCDMFMLDGGIFSAS